MALDGKLRILEAAKKVISRYGINGATMRSIAEEAGLSTGAIYHYYKSKEEILYDIMDRNLSEAKRIAKASQKDTSKTEEVTEEIYKNLVERFEKGDENRLQFYLAKEAISGNEELQVKFKEKYSEWVDKVEELMKVLYNKPETKYNKAVATMLIAAIDGIVMQVLLKSNPAELEDLCEVYHQFLKIGIPNFLDYLSITEKKDSH